jgi:hypothetical protein
MENEYMKRGYLLPDGCKDLIDSEKYKAKPGSTFLRLPILKPKPTPTAPAFLPPVIGEITFADKMTVDQLATALKQKPFQIIADLLEIGTFAALHHQVPFDAIAKIARKYGYVAKKAT